LRCDALDWTGLTVTSLTPVADNRETVLPGAAVALIFGVSKDVTVLLVLDKVSQFLIKQVWCNPEETGMRVVVVLLDFRAKIDHCAHWMAKRRIEEEDSVEEKKHDALGQWEGSCACARGVPYSTHHQLLNMIMMGRSWFASPRGSYSNSTNLLANYAYWCHQKRHTTSTGRVRAGATRVPTGTEITVQTAAVPAVLDPELQRVRLGSVWIVLALSS
jgi:hypothetical protein